MREFARSEDHATYRTTSLVLPSLKWWKIHEAVMLSLGSAQEVIEAQCIKSGNVKFDLAGFLQNVVMADIPSPGKGLFLELHSSDKACKSC